MNIWTTIDSPALRSEFDARFHRLKTTPYKELGEMPERINDTIRIDNRDITFAAYRCIRKENDLEIVLRIFIPSRRLLFTNVGQVYAEGFRIAPTGEIRPLPQEALYEYL